MATSLLLLLDDVATILDDAAILAKIATKKSAGVLGDDLALNAQQVTGFRPDRELAVVFAVAKGSLVNKAILIPVALLLSVFAPFLVVPLLMLGGLYLCYEGFEKVAHKLLHPADEQERAHKDLVAAVADPAVDLRAHERDKIRGAVRTDFILSAEIVAIVLGTVAQAPLVTRTLTLSIVGVLMVVLVYGLVAGIVKLDDLGLAMTRREGGSARIGRAILLAAPWLMKGLSVAGTAAMFLVGGGILAHGFHIHLGPEIVTSAIVGVVAGGLAVGVVTLGKRALGR